MRRKNLVRNRGDLPYTAKSSEAKEIPEERIYDHS
jgi:hypothetical protein